MTASKKPTPTPQTPQTDEWGFRNFPPTLWLVPDQPVMASFQRIVKGPPHPQYGDVLVMEVGLIKGVRASEKPRYHEDGAVDCTAIAVVPGEIMSVWLYSQVLRDDILNNRPNVGERLSLMDCGTRVKRGMSADEDGSTYRDIRVGWPERPVEDKSLTWDEALAVKPIVKKPLP